MVTLCTPFITSNSRFLIRGTKSVFESRLRNNLSRLIRGFKIICTRKSSHRPHRDDIPELELEHICSIYLFVYNFDILPKQLINCSHVCQKFHDTSIYSSPIVRVSIKISDRYQIIHALELIRAVLIINTDRMY